MQRKSLHTFQAICTSSLVQIHMGGRDHQQKRTLAFPISLGPGTQKQPLLMHLLSLQANQSAWEQPARQPNQMKEEGGKKIIRYKILERTLKS